MSNDNVKFAITDYGHLMKKVGKSGGKRNQHRRPFLVYS